MYLSLHFHNCSLKPFLFKVQLPTNHYAQTQWSYLFIVILHKGFLISSLEKYFISTAQILFPKHWFSHPEFLLEKAESISVLLMKIVNQCDLLLFLIKVKNTFLSWQFIIVSLNIRYSHINKKLMNNEIQKAMWPIVWVSGRLFLHLFQALGKAQNLVKHI